MTTENLLAAALRAESLHESLAPIMRALGIAHGDCAAAVFSALPRGDDDWPDLSLEDRRDWLVDWLASELFDAIHQVMERP
jgi:hypothetical protein